MAVNLNVAGSAKIERLRQYVALLLAPSAQHPKYRLPCISNTGEQCLVKEGKARPAFEIATIRLRPCPYAWKMFESLSASRHPVAETIFTFKQPIKKDFVFSSFITGCNNRQYQEVKQQTKR